MVGKKKKEKQVAIYFCQLIEMDFQLATLLKCLSERDALPANRPVVYWKLKRSTTKEKAHNQKCDFFFLFVRHFTSTNRSWRPFGVIFILRRYGVRQQQTYPTFNIFPRALTQNCLFRFSVTRWEFSFASFACNSHSHIIFGAQCFTFFTIWLLATGYHVPMYVRFIVWGHAFAVYLYLVNIYIA